MQNPIRPGEILLPRPGTDLSRWAVVACDQYTSEPEYWQRVAEYVGDNPSTLNIIYPEAFLSEGDARTRSIRAAMEAYLQDGVLEPAVRNGYIYIERTTQSGTRPGLVCLLDLMAYDFQPDSVSPVRATEGTIAARIPPRVRIREGAPIESPHVMVLLDDPQRTVIESLGQKKAELTKLYDFDLMESGGHLAGWAVEGASADDLTRALDRLAAVSDGLFAAVGDGNHSLATARQCYLNLKDTMSEEAWLGHPARWALIELTNLHADALQFEPIHRVLQSVNAQEVQSEFAVWCASRGMTCVPGTEIVWIAQGAETGITVSGRGDQLPVALLQAFLDKYLSSHKAVSIDYIHGSDTVRRLAAEPDSLGILLTPIDKRALFPAVRTGGPLPRKTFSMGEASEKRYYMECRGL